MNCSIDDVVYWYRSIMNHISLGRVVQRTVYGDVQIRWCDADQIGWYNVARDTNTSRAHTGTLCLYDLNNYRELYELLD